MYNNRQIVFLSYSHSLLCIILGEIYVSIYIPRFKQTTKLWIVVYPSHRNSNVIDLLILIIVLQWNLLTLPHMGDFEQLHTWGGGGALCAPPIFWVCSTNTKRMKFSEMMYHRKMRLHKENQNRNVYIFRIMTS